MRPNASSAGARKIGGAAAEAPDFAVGASFGRASASYWKHASVQQALGHWLSDWLPRHREGRALEIGAGPGMFTRLLIPWTGCLRATDLSSAMCEAGRSLVPAAEWRCMAAESPDKGPWDFVFSCGMLQWVRDPEAVFAAWKAELAPGGRIVAALFASESLPELQETMGEEGPVNWRTPEAWRRSAEAAGLRVRRDAAERRVFRFPSAIDLMRGLHRVGAAPERRWSSSRMRRFVRDYQARHGSDQGVRATWTFYRIEAE